MPFSQIQYVTIVEATAASITGVTIDGATEAITITADVSMSDLYDYTQWWSMPSRNLDSDVPITTTDSIAYTCGYALTINTGQTLSGTGTLTLGSKTLTMSGTAQSAIDITRRAGRMSGHGSQSAGCSPGRGCNSTM